MFFVTQMNDWIRGNKLEVVRESIGVGIANSIASNTRITRLVAYECELDPYTAEALAQVPTLSSVAFKGMPLSAETVAGLCKSSSITCMDLISTAVNDEIAIALAKNTTLQKLRLDTWMWNTWAHQLASSCSIRKLIATGSSMGPENAAQLFLNTSITHLNIASSDVQDRGTKNLAFNTQIRRLHINDCQLGPESALPLANNTSITWLSLQENGLGTKGAQILASNTTIETLNISYNEIGDEGAQALALNTAITHLNVADNDITDTGACEIAKNTTIWKLTIGDKGITRLAYKVLAANTTLTHLVLYEGQSRADLEVFELNKALLKFVVPCQFIPQRVEQRLMENRKKTKLVLTSITILAYLTANRRHAKRNKALC